MTSTPIQVKGYVQGSSIVVTGTAPSRSRRERFVEAMSTIEVHRFHPDGAAVVSQGVPARETVFGQLPAFAAAAPGATVRTARMFARTLNGVGFVYGAQVRDASLTQDQTAALLAESRARGIPIAVVTEAATTLSACTGPGDSVQPNQPSPPIVVTGKPLPSAASAARWLHSQARAVASPTACDELTQVQILTSSVVGQAQYDQRTDLVIDATMRALVKPSGQA